MKKKCNRCFKEKKTNEYHKDSKIKKSTGLPYRRAECKDCYNGRKSKKRREVRKKFSKYKEGLSNMISHSSYAWKTIMDEVSKCRVLCCLCHREQHGNRDES